VKFVVDERLAGFAPAHFDDWTSDWSPLERIEVRNRLVEALQSKEVNLILRPPRPGLKT
jgi:hypothetical protein